MVVVKKKVVKKQVVRRRKKRVRLIEHTSAKAGVVRLRSSWELEYLMWLDANPDVLSVEYEKLSIIYISNARTQKLRCYHPDFVVEWKDGRKEIIEVKPAKRVLGAKVVKKALAGGDYARRNGMTYRFVTEIELKKLGLLKVKRVVKKAKKV